MPVPNDIPEKIVAVLEPLIGEVLTQVSLDLESKRLGKTPETLTLDDLEAFGANLEEQLRLVVGPSVAAKAAKRVADIEL